MYMFEGLVREHKKCEMIRVRTHKTLGGILDNLGWTVKDGGILTKDAEIELTKPQEEFLSKYWLRK
jgi:hypothetical protein